MAREWVTGRMLIRAPVIFVGLWFLLLVALPFLYLERLWEGKEKAPRPEGWRAE